MTMLHEIIALEGDRQETAKQISTETITTFTKRAEHFRAEDKKLTMIDEKRKNENNTSTGEVVTTVAEKLDHYWQNIAKAIDVTATKDFANTVAQADIIIDGKTIIPNLPAIVLLSLETTLGKLRAVYNAIPTLDPSILWHQDPSSARYIYRADPVKTIKTEKNLEVVTLTKATKEHPETVTTINRDMPVGTYETTRFSGMISPKEKARALKNISILYSAVKQARQRANTHEVKPVHISSAIMDFINNN